nr:putative reverse transcriptase domain-containing protein [Tanacetum cinerariifolium]
MVGVVHVAYTYRFHELARLVPYLVTLESRKIESKDKNGRDDNKRTRTGNVFTTTVNPVGRENVSARGVPRNINPVNAKTPPGRACYECGSWKPREPIKGKGIHVGSRGSSPRSKHMTGIKPSELGFRYEIEIASGQLVEINKVIKGCRLEIEVYVFDIDLIPFEHGSFDVIIGIDWLSNHKAEIICHEKVVRIPLLDGKVVRVVGERLEEKVRLLMSVKTSDKYQEEIVVFRNFPKCHWIELFSDYDCEIRYHPGKANVVADALSRKERVNPMRVRAINMILQSRPELVQETTEKISQIKDRVKAARDRQKRYADKRRKHLEFSVDDYVLLKVSPWKDVVCFGKKGKLAPRFVGPFKIIEKKCLADPTLQVPLDEIQVDAKLNFMEEPVGILDREFKKLKRSRIAIVKILYRVDGGDFIRIMVIYGLL